MRAGIFIAGGWIEEVATTSAAAAAAAFTFNISADAMIEISQSWFNSLPHHLFPSPAPISHLCPLNHRISGLEINVKMYFSGILYFISRLVIKLT